MDRIENERRNQIEREEERDRKWATPYGDKKGDRERNEQHLVKIMTYNVGSFPKIGTVKQELLKRITRQYQVIGMSELNTNWTKISAQELLYSRTEKWYDHPKTQVAWLCDQEWPSVYQQGGVSLTIQGHLLPYVQERGTDETGLGRWAWYTLEGRSEVKTAIIQVY